MTAPSVPPSSLEIDDALRAAHVVALPMRTRFRGQTVREAMLLQGPAGWAEFAPFPEYSAEESAAWWGGALEAGWSAARSVRREAIPVNATVPAVPPREVEGVLSQFGALERIPAVKVKVAESGQRLEDDVARFREVRRLLPQAGIRADANGGWSLEEAERAVAALGEVAGDALEYVEQPVAGIEPLADLRERLQRRGIAVKIAADEAVRKAADPLRVARLGAAEILVVKAAPLGGVERAAQIVAESGLDAVVSSALDTSIGLTRGLALAARLERLPYACGLGTVALLARDVVAEPLIPAEGFLSVPLQEGRPAAPSPSPQVLQECAVSPERRQWWVHRAQQAHELWRGRTEPQGHPGSSAEGRSAAAGTCAI